MRVVVFQSPSHVQFFETLWTAAHQASLSFTISWSLPKFMSIESVMPSNHLTLCCTFSFCLQSFPPSESLPMAFSFTSGNQSIGASASVLPVIIQGKFPLRLTGLISLLSKGISRVFLQVVLVVKNPPANVGDARYGDSIPGSGRCPGGGHRNALQYSCLENHMDRGAWWATVHGVTTSWT